MTDASGIAVGGALLQEQDGCVAPISFISETFSATEKKYSATKREALAVIYALKKVGI